MEIFVFVLFLAIIITIITLSGVNSKVTLLEKRLKDLDDNLRRLNLKFSSSFPGTAEARPQATPKPIEPTAPIASPQQTNKPKQICSKCLSVIEVGDDFCDQCGSPAPQKGLTSNVPTPQIPNPVPPPSTLRPALPVFSDFSEPSHKPARATPAATSVPPARKVEPAFTMPAIDWENFMGVKLFAWLGGFALFLGMAFFVKYSIDHNLISPWMRVIIGFFIGLGTIIGGLALRKKDYEVTVHTLVASGIAILYADVFASRSLYNFLSTEMAFPCMILVTVAAFLLAVRLNSKYVAILGMVGGFLTPPMLSTGVDHPIALFSYILLLDIGLAAVTIHQGWGFLLGLSALATFVMEAGWTLKFFSPEKAWLALGIYVTFGIFFLIVSSIAGKSDKKDATFQVPADYMPLFSMGFVGYLLSIPELGAHPGVIFTLLFTNLALLGWQAIRRSESRLAYMLGALASYLLLGIWTARYLTPELALLGAGLYVALCLFTFFVSSQAEAKQEAQSPVHQVANVMPLLSLGLVFYFLTIPALGSNPVLIFSLLFILSALLSGRAIFGKGSRVAYAFGVLAGFVLLVVWSAMYLKPDRILMASGIYLAFTIFHLLVSRVAGNSGDRDENIHSPADYLPLGSMGFVWYMLHFPALGHRPGIMLSVLLFLGAVLAYRALKRPEARIPYGLGGAVSFFILSSWTVQYMRSSLLLWGLGYYMAFALVHTLYPIFYQRLRASAKPLLAGFVAPMLGLVLILVAMIACDILAFLLWPFVLVLGLMGVALAWLAGSLFAAGGTVLLVMSCFAVWLFRLPDPAGLPGALLLLGVFTAFFFAWTLLVTRGKSLFAGNAFLSRAGSISSEDAAQLPAMAALMPFALLMMVCLKLPMENPSDVFLLAFFIDLLLLALTRYRKMELLVPVALGSTALLEFVWLGHNHPLAQPHVALVWALVFYGLFMAFPFIVRRHLRGLSAWRCSALAGLVQWPVVWDSVTLIAGVSSRALVPGLFAVPSLLSLIGVLSHEKNEERVSKLAWFGGITLFFVTLIIPIQFDKEWLTVGWTLEGAALLWLFRRVPHDGLKAWGLGLLAVCFARLALNPAVLSYHPRTDAPILNWYLWVYGAAALSFYLGAWFLRSSPRFMETEVPPLLKAGGTLLSFLLLNIEIANFFSTGQVITFNFSGNLAQDMTYSLSWAVFSILLLVAGIRQESKGARYASISLLTATLAKLFLHDLWRLGGLYRVASFVGLAVVLILVSFLYQKFLGNETKSGRAS